MLDLKPPPRGLNLNKACKSQKSNRAHGINRHVGLTQLGAQGRVPFPGETMLAAALRKPSELPLAALYNALFVRVDIASLAVFRVAFGGLLIWEVARYWSSGAIAGMYVDPPFHFTYLGFDWIAAWPGNGMYIHFIVLAGLAFLIMIGLWYRISAILFFFGFTYLLLIDQAYYLNHFYLISLISLLLIFVPAHNAFSVDALIYGRERDETVPAWSLWLLRFQIGLVYFYGGIAKLNSDWLAAEPMRIWMAARPDFPLIGTWFTENWLVYSMSYGGLLIDLLAVPLLLWGRTRIFMLILLILFHTLNSELFAIGIFPWLMIAGTLIFFSPSWPRPFLQVATRYTPDCWPKSEEGPTRQRGRWSNWLGGSRLNYMRYLGVTVLGIYLALQVLVPLRHYLYSSHANWSEEGSRFSWRMMLRTKAAQSQVLVTDPVSGITSEIDPSLRLTSYQVEVMSKFPDMVLQWSHYVADDIRQQGYDQIQVRANVIASLNGRSPQLLIDPSVDLAKEERTLGGAVWILPLEQ